MSKAKHSGKLSKYIVNINCKYGLIKGSWSASFTFDFKGILLVNGNERLRIEFAVPYGFIKKFGKNATIDQIKYFVEDEYIKNSPSLIK
jgi:hypothetical protein